MATFSAIFPPATNNATTISLPLAGSRATAAGTSDVITVSPDATINTLTARTEMVWFKSSMFGNGFDDQTLFARGANAFLDVLNAATFPDEASYGAVATGASFNTSDNVVVDTWTHVALTCDFGGDKKSRVYINAVEVASYTTQTAGSAAENDSAIDLIIGAFPGGTDETGDTQFYDFRLYNSVLTPAQIATIVAGGISTDPAPTHNKCQLTFAVDLGATETDASGNGNDGAITGTTFIEGDNPFVDPDVVIGSSASGTMFVITANQDILIRFGNSDNIADPTSNSLPILAKTYMTFQLPVGADRFRVLRNTGNATTVWYWQLAKG